MDIIKSLKDKVDVYYRQRINANLHWEMHNFLLSDRPQITYLVATNLAFIVAQKRGKLRPEVREVEETFKKNLNDWLSRFFGEIRIRSVFQGWVLRYNRIPYEKLDMAAGWTWGHEKNETNVRDILIT